MNRTCFFKAGARHAVPLRTISGMSLIAIIVLLLFIGMAAVVSSSLVGTGNIGGANVVQSAQALAAAHAGKEWYLEQIQGDPDWTTNEAALTNNALGTGFFDISVASRIPTRIIFTSTGRVINPEGLTVRRRMTVTARKLPPAFQFALFEGSNTGVQFDIPDVVGNTCVITGDSWFRGSDVNLRAGSTHNGIIYVPNSALVTGCSGSCSAKSVPPPLLTMPVISTTPYTSLMDSYDTTIGSSTCAGTTTQSVNLTLTGNTITSCNFTTSGAITISGTGTIVARQNLNLHTGAAGSLTVTPAGGDIRFLAGRNLTVGTTVPVTLNKEALGPGVCRLYSRAGNSAATPGGNTGQLVDIIGANTQIHGAHIYARRRIQIRAGSDVDQASVLFIWRADSNTNNQIIITATGSTVNGSVLSMGRNNPNLQIISGASVTGLVYSFDTGNNGRIALNNCTITGSVVADRYLGDDIRRATITYSPASFPDPLPEGFDGFVMKEPDSWDGL
ncbi:MAG: hypothetical protein HY587_06170 [Candidatus Omnitrophica bacterium]|nr:hypothetical protein [Candidatus Omnitrophota bacterium]